MSHFSIERKRYWFPCRYQSVAHFASQIMKRLSWEMLLWLINSFLSTWTRSILDMETLSSIFCGARITIWRENSWFVCLPHLSLVFPTKPNHLHTCAKNYHFTTNRPWSKSLELTIKTAFRSSGILRPPHLSTQIRKNQICAEVGEERSQYSPHDPSPSRSLEAAPCPKPRHVRVRSRCTFELNWLVFLFRLTSFR